MQLLHHLSLGIGALGIGIILTGVARGTRLFIMTEFAALTGGDVPGRRQELRHLLGYYLLLGLEFLIAADILDTLMRPELKELLTLGAIVAIRTVIAWSLNAELGRSRATEAFAAVHG